MRRTGVLLGRAGIETKIDDIGPTSLIRFQANLAIVSLTRRVFPFGGRQ